MFFRRKKQVMEVKRRVGVPSRSCHDVACFPLQAQKMVGFGLGERGFQVSMDILDLPREINEKIAFIKQNCDVFLACDANRDFLDMLMDKRLERSQKARGRALQLPRWQA